MQINQNGKESEPSPIAFLSWNLHLLYQNEKKNMFGEDRRKKPASVIRKLKVGKNKEKTCAL